MRQFYVKKFNNIYIYIYFYKFKAKLYTAHVDAYQWVT